MTAPMFDPAAVPPEVVSAAGVDEVNRLVEVLRGRLVARIKMAEAGSQFRTSNVIRAYNQAQIRRCLMFLQAGWNEVISGNGLVALTCVRAVYETVAAFLDFEGKVIALVKAGNVGDVHAFMKTKTYATRLVDLIEVAGDPAVQATNILTQIDKMTAVRPDVRAEYDHLCEYAHPNVFGSYLYFARDDREADATDFTDISPDPADDLKWVLVSARLLTHMVDALDRIEADLPALGALGAAQTPHGDHNG